MKKKFFFLPLTIFITIILVSFQANALEIQSPFAFVDRFPGNSQHLGFPKGNMLQVGAFIIPSEGVEIFRVVAKNLTNGLELDAISFDFEPRPGLYLVIPMPLFNPDEHFGVWEIEAEDVNGDAVIDATHELDKEAAMPYVRDVYASGDDPLAPTITWEAPEEKQIPEFCLVRYRIRLLKNADEQIFVSPITPILSWMIPEDVLVDEDLPDTYVRIECLCLDPDDFGHPVPIELRSETFRPLQDLLFEIP